MRLALTAALAILAAPAAAGVGEALDAHILPRYEAFAAGTADLAETARADCTATALRPAFQAAFDAWMGVSHLRLGPVEEDGRVMAIAFWPDARSLTEGTLRDLIAQGDPVVERAGAFAEVSVAARGLFALELLLYDDAFSEYGADSYSCALVRAVAGDLARMAEDVLAEWQSGFAETLRTAGQDGNEVFLSEREASQALFTALTTGLEFTADQRLSRPMGTFERPRPTRAEAWRSGRSLRNVVLSLEALRELAVALSNEPPTETLAAFDTALETAGKLDDPVFAGVETPEGRLKVEALQQRITTIRQTAAVEIGKDLGVAAGFNSADGD